MKHLNGRRMVQVAACLALLVYIGCTGKRGPTGPKGDQGDQGPAGSVTSEVYAGKVPSNQSGYFVAIPSMTLDDPPLVSTFVQVSPGEYDELPLAFVFEGDSTVSLLYASIKEGGVTLWFCQGLDYIIVVMR